MAQFYFLSVLFNIIAGLILIYGKDLTGSNVTDLILSDSENDAVEASEEDEKSDEEVFEEAETAAEEEIKASKKRPHINPFKNIETLDNSTLRLICGVLCAFVAVMKLLSVFRNDVPVIGDLIPAVAGLAGGAALLLEYYVTHATVDNEVPVWCQKLFIDSRKYVGILCLVAGLLHFVFPQVILL